jgi:hypothetical protein
LLMQERDEEAFKGLSKLRRLPADHPALVAEALDIRASVMLESTFVREHHANLSGFRLHVAQVGILFFQLKVAEKLTLLVFVLD